MGKFEVKTESQLKGNADKPAKKKKTFWGKFFDVVLTVVLVASFLFSGTVIFFKVRYEACFVSGMSMYPTLNASAVNSEGKVISPYHGTGFVDGSKVDYCLSDEKNNFKDKIERFDIVCSYYSSDYNSDGTLKSSASQKIKRVIGLPGETIWLVKSGNTGSRYSGTLYVSTDPNLKDANIALGPTALITAGYDIKEVAQPVSDEVYDEAVRASFGDESLYYNNGEPVNYAYYAYSYWQLSPKTETSSGEYVLLGDNRMSTYSSDSRFVGKINGDHLCGKVIAVIGKGTIKDNESTCSFNYFSFKWRNL